MNKIYLKQLVNIVVYAAMQILIPPLVSLYGTSFMYIGFLLFLPWARNNMMWQLLLSFVIGLLMDTFYQGVGNHTFAAVLLLYCRNLFLYFFIVSGSKYARMVTPTFGNLGVGKFLLYTFSFTVLYHVIVFLLDHQAIQLLLLYPAKFFLSICISYLAILFPSLFVEAILRIYAK
jgi:hypothetical protein